MLTKRDIIKHVIEQCLSHKRKIVKTKRVNIKSKNSYTLRLIIDQIYVIDLYNKSITVAFYHNHAHIGIISGRDVVLIDDPFYNENDYNILIKELRRIIDG